MCKLKNVTVKIGLFCLAGFILSGCGGQKKQSPQPQNPPVVNTAPEAAHSDDTSPVTQMNENPELIPATAPHESIHCKKDEVGKCETPQFRTDWLLQCRYNQPPMKGVQNHYSRCMADGHICAYSKTNRNASEGEHCHDRMTVICDGETIFPQNPAHSGKPDHLSENGVEFLLGHVNSDLTVILAYPSQHPEAPYFSVDSQLKIGNIPLTGACEFIFRSRPVSHDSRGSGSSHEHSHDHSHDHSHKDKHARQ